MGNIYTTYDIELMGEKTFLCFYRMGDNPPPPPIHNGALEPAVSFNIMSNAIPKKRIKKAAAPQPPHRGALPAASSISPNDLESVKYGSSASQNSTPNTTPQMTRISSS